MIAAAVLLAGVVTTFGLFVVAASVHRFAESVRTWAPRMVDELNELTKATRDRVVVAERVARANTAPSVGTHVAPLPAMSRARH
jgi:hypothetical protein